MPGSHFKIAYRSLLHFKTLSILNIIGLAVGISTSVLLLLFVAVELSYDRFHPDRERIYRVTTKVNSPDGQVLYLPTCLGWTPEVIHEQGFPEVIATRVYRNQLGNNLWNGWKDQVRFYYADSTFFDLFGFRMLAGDPGRTLNEPGTVVISKSMAEKYFSDRDPLGKSIEIYKNFYKVCGVMEDVPFNSHLQFDVLISFVSLKKELDVRQRSMDFPVYLKVGSEADPGYLHKLSETIRIMHVKHYGEAGLSIETRLQNLEDVHLRSTELSATLHPPGDVNDLVILFSLAMFILLITISNFINLLTANNRIRIRDMGMRIVLGAQKRQLLYQLIRESVLVGLSAAFLSIVLIELNLGPFSSLVDAPIKLSFPGMAGLFLLIIAVSVILGFLSGWIHFISMIRFAPARMISGLRIPLKYDRLKVILVVIQFSIVIFIFSVLSVLLFQTRTMKKGDYGYDRENLFVFHEPFTMIRTEFESAAKDISTVPGVKAVTASLGIPGHNPVIQNAWKEGNAEANAIIITENRVNRDYVRTFRFEMLAGEGFSWDSPEADGGFLVNESAKEALGLEEPVGSVLNVWNHRDTVVGVLRDYHFKSWHDKIEPIVISRKLKPFRYITVRVESDTARAVLGQVQASLEKHFPGNNFMIFALSEMHDQMYEDEDKNTRLYSGGALLAIMIGIFGLIALTTYTTVRRTKEIGIRKAMGGDRSSIFLLLGGDTLRWILLSAIIATPLAWFAVNNWLQRFYYSIEYAGLLIILSVLLAMVLAMASIGWQLIRISRQNPLDSLRYE